MSRDALRGGQGGIEKIEPEWVPLQVAARLVSVSPRTLRRWINRGLPVYQSGPRTKLLVRVRDIEAFLKRKQVSSVDLDTMVDAVMAELGQVSHGRQGP